MLHIVGTAHEHGTAVARLVTALAVRLDPTRYRFHAWVLGGSGPLSTELENAGITVGHLGWTGSGRDPVGAWRFWRALRHHRFDIVHLHAGGVLLRLLAREGARAALICHLHSRVLESRSLRPVKLPTWPADAVIAVSEAVARHASGATARVVYPGIATPPHRRGGAAGLVVGTACRLVPGKGVKYLLRAVAELRGEFPELRLEIAGSGAALPALEREARWLGIVSSVEFLGWQHRLDPLLERWDIFVLPSLEEGFGFVLLEAMASGVPVIASAVGGTQEVVRDGATGLLFPAGDARALAGCLRLLLSDAPRRRALAAAARSDVSERFDVAQMAKQVTAVYDQTLSSPVRRTRSV